MRKRVEPPEPDNAHYEQSGYAVVFMGGFAFALYAAVSLLQVELGFIRAPGIAVIGFIFLFVGTSMVWLGQQREE